jgi:class 3 adenylate cyclase
MSPGRPQRRLAVIFAADVVGHSRLMGKDEAGTLAALKALRTELIDRKSTGDGLLAEFPRKVSNRQLVKVTDVSMSRRLCFHQLSCPCDVTSVKPEIRHLLLPRINSRGAEVFHQETFSDKCCVMIGEKAELE